MTHNHPDARPRKVPFWVVVLSVLFFGVFSVQLVRSLNIDAFQLSGTRIDILGFWISVLISGLLGLRSIAQRSFALPALVLVLCLIAHLSIVFALTDVQTPFEAFLISRHGILMWFVLGMGVASVIAALSQMDEGRQKRRIRLLISTITFLTFVSAAETAYDYISSPVATENYQPAAATGIVIMILNFLMLEAIWNGKTPNLLRICLALGSGFLVVAIALMQSTLIVLFGFVFLILLLYKIYCQLKNKIIGVFGILVLLMSLVGLYKDTVEELIEKTRFAELMGAEKEFSPLANRLNLLTTFDEQFRVSPFFGNFNAENIAFAGEGLYIHSLPLSFLTHSGVIGFSFFVGILLFIVSKRIARWSMLSDMDRVVMFFIFVVLAIGSVATFLTWPVFWFMLGVGVSRPVFTIRGA